MFLQHNYEMVQHPKMGLCQVDPKPNLFNRKTIYISNPFTYEVYKSDPSVTAELVAFKCREAFGAEKDSKHRYRRVDGGGGDWGP